MSKKDLENKLNEIKKILEEVNVNNKIVFFDLNSFYSYLKIYYNVDLNKLMDEIEPFIPLKLCIEGNRELYSVLNIALEEDKLEVNEIQNLKKIFYNKARMSFLELIKKANNEKKWEDIVNLCEELRQDLEES